MSAFDSYIWEIQTARVEFTPGGRSPFRYNDMEDVNAFTKMILKKEIEYFQEYVTLVQVKGQELWVKIYANYLKESKNYFHTAPNSFMLHTGLDLLSGKLEQMKEKIPDLFHLLHQFVNEQYTSLNRVCTNILPECSNLYCPFTWDGGDVQLLEYSLFPFMNGQIVPLYPQASQRMWIETMFLLLHQTSPKYLYQSIQKLLLRNEPCKYLHTLEKGILKKLDNPLDDR